MRGAVRAYDTTARPVDTQFHGRGCMDYLKLNVDFYYQGTLRSLMCLDHF